MAQAGLTWDEATLDRFLTNPDILIPGHNMKPFAGSADEAQRAKIIAFLKSGA